MYFFYENKADHIPFDDYGEALDYGIREGKPFYIHMSVAPFINIILVSAGLEPMGPDYERCVLLKNPQDAVNWVRAWYNWRANGGTMDEWESLLFGEEEEKSDAN